MYKYTFREPSLMISMQYFADENNTGNTDESGQQNNNEPQSQKPTWDDVMKDKTIQSEFDKRVNKAIETAKAKWDADAKEKANEAEKLANMQAEEKAKYERDKAIKALEERERAVLKREMKAEARSQLSEMSLPIELSDCLDYTDAESCKKSMESVSTAFNKAVELAVNERLKAGAGAPKKGVQNTAKPYEGMSIDEKMAYANEHPNELQEILKSFEKKK